MTLDPTTTKYLIRAKIITDGIVDKPDVVGAIFGQTEGLLGDDLDLRDMQKSGRVGRIEVELNSGKGKSEGSIVIPSSLDQVETAILASSLETIERVGPCKSKVEIQTVEDVRAERRKKIVDRAKDILKNLIADSKNTSLSIMDAVKEDTQIYEICYISDNGTKLPAGPNAEESDAIIVVEGRNDVLNLLKHGIKNAVAVEGTSIPSLITRLSSEKVLTAFVDGDRGGELILRELLEVAEVDYVARAPKGKEVEELTGKQIMKILKNKIPAIQFMEMYGINARSDINKPTPLQQNNQSNQQGGGQSNHNNHNKNRNHHNGRNDYHDRDDDRRRHDHQHYRKEEPSNTETTPVQKETPLPETPSMPEPDIKKPQTIPEAPADEEYDEEYEEDVSDDYVEEMPQSRKVDESFLPVIKVYEEIKNSKNTKFISRNGALIRQFHQKDIITELKKCQKGAVWAVIFDGIINQAIMNLAAKKGIDVIVGNKRGAISKRPPNLRVFTADDMS